MKRRGLVLSAVLAGALMTKACAAQTGTGTAAAGDVQQKVVNVTASETVTAEPDIAEFEMTVSGHRCENMPDSEQHGS